MSGLDDFLKQRKEMADQARGRAQEVSTTDSAASQYLQNHAQGEWAHGRSLQKSGNGLILGYVAATFDDGMLVNNVPRGTRILFGRMPYGQYVDDSRIESEVWELEATVRDGEIAWQMDGSLIAAGVLAVEVIKRLVIYWEEYEAAYGRSV
jgi:hypothetical protein